MSAAGALPEVRREIAEQVGRMELLVCNVLDYARVWRLECRPMRLAEAVERALTGVPGRL